MLCIRWVGGSGHPQGGKFPEASQNRRLKTLATERNYTFVVVSECCSDIINPSNILNSEARIYMAGQSSLNTLQALEEVMRANLSIKKAIILPRPPRRDDLRLHLLSQLGSRELKKA